MGACRHGEKCDRRHNRPTESQTVLFSNMYQPPPQFVAGPRGDVMLTEAEIQETFEEFYVDVFVEFAKIGLIEELNVCFNPGTHLNGNVYVKFSKEIHASIAVQKLHGRLYDGKPILPELSPVTEFSEARCRQYAMGNCERKMCNFLHLKEPSRNLFRDLHEYQRHKWSTKNRDSRSHRRDNERERSKSRENSPVRRDDFGRDIYPTDNSIDSNLTEDQRYLLEKLQRIRRPLNDEEEEHIKKRNLDDDDDDSNFLPDQKQHKN